MIKPDVLLDIKFYTTDAGGRTLPTASNFYGCVFEFQGKNHDGRLLLENIGSIYPGDSKKSVPLKFLDPDSILKDLTVGSILKIREGRYIGEAVVAQIC